MRILICGGRDFADLDRFVAAMVTLREKHGDFIIINGGCRTGADKYARAYAMLQELPYVTVPAKFKTLGKKAGPLRNQWMIDHVVPQAAVAFPGGAGTADMVRRLRKASIPVWIPYGGVNES
jgi:hypothetical protein